MFRVWGKSKRKVSRCAPVFLLFGVQCLMKVVNTNQGYSRHDTQRPTSHIQQNQTRINGVDPSLG